MAWLIRAMRSAASRLPWEPAWVASTAWSVRSTESFTLPATWSTLARNCVVAAFTVSVAVRSSSPFRASS